MINEIFILIVLLFSIIIHEIAHGSVALSLGDPTAKDAGRLTLNPLKHLDLFGSVILPLFSFLLTGRVFGFAKPVPINSYNFRDQKTGILKVSIAGPAMNFLIAILFGLIVRFLTLPQSLLILFSIIIIYNFALGIFNLVPIPPLDGYHVFFTFLPARWQRLKLFLQQYGFFILIFFLYFGIDLIFRGAIILFSLVSGQSFLM